ncbi:MAG: REP-associated tyrosine transposase [Terriglobales bacterium]
MTKGLHRYYGTPDLHFITWSCYRRQPLLGTPARRDLLLKILEAARRKYRFVVHGYVVMPEHVHLLTTEPEMADPSVVMKVVKQRFTMLLNKKRRARSVRQRELWASGPDPIWQKRFYDFSVWSEHKRVEKLRYMHRNPVKRGLVEQPDQWKWSSFRSYFYGERGPVRVNYQEWMPEIASRPIQKFGNGAAGGHPLIRKERE